MKRSGTLGLLKSKMGFLMAARITDCDLVFILYIAMFFDAVVRVVSLGIWIVWSRLGMVCIVRGDCYWKVKWVRFSTIDFCKFVGLLEVIGC